MAFQSVTVGTKAAELIEKWDKEDKYTDAYYLHGLAVEIGAEIKQKHPKLNVTISLRVIDKTISEITDIVDSAINANIDGILIDGFVFKKIEDKVMTKWGLR